MTFRLFLFAREANSSCSPCNKNVGDEANNHEAKTTKLHGVVIYSGETKVRR